MFIIGVNESVPRGNVSASSTVLMGHPFHNCGCGVWVESVFYVQCWTFLAGYLVFFCKKNNLFLP